VPAVGALELDEIDGRPSDIRVGAAHHRLWGNGS
jgi:hypothetical protein